MEQINIQGDKCWICGCEENITSHHALPKHLKPNKNVLIPVCRDCHDKIHNEDINGMTSHLFKLTRDIEQVKRQAVTINNQLSNFIILKTKKK